MLLVDEKSARAQVKRPTLLFDERTGMPLQDATPQGVDVEVVRRARKLMDEKNLSAKEAQKRVFMSDRDLLRRYQLAHGSFIAD